MLNKHHNLFNCASPILLILCVALALIPIFLILSSVGIFVDYSGWGTVEVPTDTPTKATVKLPKNWRFVTEEGRIYIKDENDDVIAGELYEGWGNYKDLSETNPNESYSHILDDYTDKELVCANIDVCTVTKYAFEESEDVYLLTIPVYFSSNDRCHYELAMIIKDEYFDSKVFLKLVESYRSPEDYIQKDIIKEGINEYFGK